MFENKEPVKICRVGGREFHIYREFDEAVQMHYLTYPDFTEHPEYTEDGRLFTRSDREDCPQYTAIEQDDPSEECGGCRFFHREETPHDVIGICMCDVLRCVITDSHGEKFNQNDNKNKKKGDFQMEKYSSTEQRLHVKKDCVEVWEDGYRTEGEAGTFEWWYFDAQLDGGFNLSIIFFAKDMLDLHKPIEPTVSFEFNLPDGKRIAKQLHVPKSDFNAAIDRCDVTIGDCRITGDLKTYDIYFKHEEITAKVHLESTVPAWREGTGYIGEENYMAWLATVPSGKVQAEITIGDEKYNLSGDGYHDHNWGNIFMPNLVNRWYWERAKAGDYDMITVYTTLEKEFNYVSYPTFMLAKNGKILADNHECVRVKTENVSIDPVSKKPIHDRLIYDYDDGKKQYRVTYQKKDIILNEGLLDALEGNAKFKAMQAGFDGAYIRYTGDVTVECIEGGKVVDTATGSGILELMYFGHVPPDGKWAHDNSDTAR